MDSISLLSSATTTLGFLNGALALVVGIMNGTTWPEYSKVLEAYLLVVYLVVALEQ
jgi:hypothetical protein